MSSHSRWADVRVRRPPDITYGAVPCGCVDHPVEHGIVAFSGHAFSLDTADKPDPGLGHKWRWQCSCGGRGRWTWQSDSAAYHAWLRHVGLGYR